MLQMVKDKWLKILFIMMLLLGGAILTGETTITQLRDCFPFLHVEMDMTDTSPEALREVQEVFREKNIELLAEVYNFDSESDTARYRMYGSEQAIAAYQANTSLKDGRLFSLFGSDIEYRFYDFLELATVDMESIFAIRFFLISEDNLLQTLPAEWILELGIDDLLGKNVSVRQKLWNNILYIWGVIFLTSLVFVYYDILQQKKRFFIQVAYGDTLSRLIGSNILLDSCVYGVFFIVVCVVMSFWVPLPWGWKTFGIIGSLFILGNAVMYLPLFRYSFREALSGTSFSQKELLFLHMIHVVVLVATIVLLGINTEVMRQFITYRNLENFYEGRQDMYTIRTHMREDDFYLLERYYLEHVEDGSVELYDTSEHHVDEASHDYSIIYLNKNSIEWLKTVIPELREYDFTTGNFFCFYPDCYQVTDPETEFTRSPMCDFEGITEEVVRVIASYPAGISVSTSLYGSTLEDAWKHNPVFYVDMRKGLESLLPYLEVTYGAGAFSSYWVKIEGNPDNPYIIAYDGSVVECESVYQSYQYEVQGMRRMFTWYMCIFLLVLALELSIVIRIIQLEFETNAKQYIIKRLFGEGLLQTYKGLFVTTAILFGAGYVLSRIQIGQMNVETSTDLATPATVILFLGEILLIFAYILRMENVAKQKVLKGGSL